MKAIDLIFYIIVGGLIAALWVFWSMINRFWNIDTSGEDVDWFDL